MSKDKIEVNMNVYDIPIVVEVLEEANKEIERLKELCDKYEEEHKTTFEIWQKDIKENEHLRTALNSKESIIKEAIEYIENDLQISILPNNQIINGTEVVKRINKIIEILKGRSDK